MRAHTQAPVSPHEHLSDHDLPEVHFEWPDAMGPAERIERVESIEDICVLDHERYFIRGILPIFVDDFTVPWLLHLWVEVRATDCARYILRADEGNFDLGARHITGKIANEVAPFLDALHSKVRLTPEAHGIWATLWFTPRDRCTLAQAQLKGLTYEQATRAIEIIRACNELPRQEIRWH